MLFGHHLKNAANMKGETLLLLLGTTLSGLCICVNVCLSDSNDVSCVITGIVLKTYLSDFLKSEFKSITFDIIGQYCLVKMCFKYRLQIVDQSVDTDHTKVSIC